MPPLPGIPNQGLKNAALAPDQSAFSMLANGIDGLAARLELIGAARQELDLQYYIFRGDVSGTLVSQALLRAADRGVQVRILVDDGESVAGDERLFALAAHPFIQIRVFNPFNYRGHNRAARALDFVFHKKRLDHRMHNKLIVADNALALIGGRNVGDQYFQIAPDSQFGDDDVAVEGPLVSQLSGVFDEFWNSPLSIPIGGLEPEHASQQALEAFRTSTPAVRAQSTFDSDLAKRLASGEPLAGAVEGRTHLSVATAQVIYDSPDKGRVLAGAAPRKLIYAEVEARASDMTTELLMITPYFVPSPKQLDLLKSARGRNVHVRVLTNSLEAAPDVTPHAGYSRFRPALLGAGMELFEIRARVESAKGTGQPTKLSRRGNYALHAKLYVFDRQSLFVGSLNFDQRSEHLNTEIGLLIDSPELAVGAAKRFESLTQPSNAYAVKLEGGESAAFRHLIWVTEKDGVTTEQSVEPARSGWQRFKMRVLTWLPLDKEL
ncbi:MAG: phospholipase D family protein [Pseudomonadota bacterium]|nr:phospholipase D family protein [Pseudomonadota bacterium]